MKIEKRWAVLFKDIRRGQAFEHEAELYICSCILDVTGRTIANAVNLENGKYKIIAENAEVTLYENAKVVLI